MSYQIIESCVTCHACEPLCPARAIYRVDRHFSIDANKCTGCDGDYADPQCVSICPIEGAILDPSGVAANPPGSLTGIAPERLPAAMAEIQAR